MKPTLLALMFLGLSAALPLQAKPSLEFQVLNAAKEQVDLADFNGQVVYLDFWASWCGPCRKSFPWMNQMHDKYQQQGLAVVAINLDQEPEIAQAFLNDTSPKFNILYNPDGDVATAFDLMGMPSSYMFNRQGKLVHTHIGFFEKNKAKYEQQLQQLLQEK